MIKNIASEQVSNAINLFGKTNLYNMLFFKKSKLKQGFSESKSLKGENVIESQDFK